MHKAYILYGFKKSKVKIYIFIFLFFFFSLPSKVLYNFSTKIGNQTAKDDTY